MESTLLAARLTTLPGTAWRGGVPRTAPCKGRSPRQWRLRMPPEAVSVDESPRPRGALHGHAWQEYPGHPCSHPLAVASCTMPCLQRTKMDSEEVTGTRVCVPRTYPRRWRGKEEPSPRLSGHARPWVPTHREVTQAFRAFWTFTRVAYSPRRQRDAELGGDRW
ncbi:hypothetical protein NN561_012775 [Cricetulus griseus]